MHHDNTMPLEYTLLLYCIIKKQTFNLGWVMNRALLGWMGHFEGAKPFPTTMEKLCFKYLPTLARYPKIEMGVRVNLAGLNRLRTLHLNKEEELRQNT